MNQSNISSIPLSQGQQRYRINRRLGKLDLSLRTSNTDSIIMSDDISVLQRSLKSGKVKVKLSSSMKKALNSMDCESIPNDEKLILKNVQKSWENIKFKDKKNHLTLKKLITIIRLGLLINKDDIYLSDLLRWIYEGHLHVNRVNLFLPPNVHHSIPLS
ncbi:uncharacterized protein LOC126910092, partial [Daktulosphaira vitifoliae]|uniref:uncharacterized protein LOC126910092 n=1 Tax=Daktulosphaira vitifoliae TaxID=58002 RepID=UPI0021AA35DB